MQATRLNHTATKGTSYMDQSLTPSFILFLQNKGNLPLLLHSSWLENSPLQTQYRLKSEVLPLPQEFPQI